MKKCIWDGNRIWHTLPEKTEKVWFCLSRPAAENGIALVGYDDLRLAKHY